MNFRKPLIIFLFLISGLLISSVAPAGQPAEIDAGPDQTVRFNSPLLLNAVVTDTQAPYLTIGWSKVSGPGTVTFSSQRSATTEVFFSEPGEYQLMLGGYDGDVAYDFVQVTVTQ